ncbi:MAG: L-rhamnose mutarotase [Actinomycetota bacterium]|nr:L-rhamnose mutarotase [Glaciihabitans sp.]MDQ1561040.1 L-rhamnose mutarotase [Actinomycetota bacterium]
MTVQFTFATTILRGREASYDEIHRVTPVELDRVIRAAGTRFWRIEREGINLFHFVEVDEIDRFDAVLDASEVNARWQLVVGPLLESGSAERTIVEDFEFGQGELVWVLPAEG